MLYIFMALYAEAVPFIAQMKLKRVNDSGKFVLYQDGYRPGQSRSGGGGKLCVC